MSKRLIWHKEEIQEVIKLLLFCKNEEEVELIFDRILTPREINDIGRRYKVLKMIDEGKSFTEILMETKMSSTTISRISAKCGYGFRKTSGLKHIKKKPAKENKFKTIKYKGAPAFKVKR